MAWDRTLRQGTGCRGKEQGVEAKEQDVEAECTVTPLSTWRLWKAVRKFVYSKLSPGTWWLSHLYPIRCIPISRRKGPNH